MTTKDIKKYITRNDENLHTMYQAINAVSQMTAHQKELIDNLHTLYRDSSERIKLLEESCQLKKK